MHHSFLIHSLADRHLGCFLVLAIVNSAAMNIGVHMYLSNFNWMETNSVLSTHNGWIIDAKEKKTIRKKCLLYCCSVIKSVDLEKDRMSPSRNNQEKYILYFNIAFDEVGRKGKKEKEATMFSISSHTPLSINLWYLNIS